MKKMILLSLATSFAFASAASAQVTVYGSDQAGFTAAAGPLVTETFESCPGVTASFAGSLSSSSGPCGTIAAGVTFSPQDGGLYIAAPGQSTNPTTALGLNLFSGDAINIQFDGGTTAFGANLYQNFAGGAQGLSDAEFIIALFGAGDVSLGIFNTLVSPNGGDYYSLTSLDTIFRAEVHQTGGFAVLDNVSFSLNGAVPEPGTWAMMLLGFGMAGFAMRRGRKELALPQAA